MGKKFIVDQIFSYEDKFFTILKTVIKSLTGKIFGSPMKTKLTLINNFLKMFTLYLENLLSRDAEDNSEFDSKSFIENSFVYSAYWALCMGYLDQFEHSIIEDLMLTELFPQLNEISCISEYLLNEDN